MPMLIYIYKNNLGDCTNNGVSSRDIRLMSYECRWAFEPCKDYRSRTCFTILDMARVQITS